MKALSLSLVEFLLPLAVVLVWFVGVLVPVVAWLSTKVEALIQDRHGPDRASVQGFRLLGLLAPFAVILRALGLRRVDSRDSFARFASASLLCLCALLTLALLPFGETLRIGSFTLYGQLATFSSGIWVLLGLLGLQQLATLLASAGSTEPMVRQSLERNLVQTALALPLLWLTASSVTLAYGSTDLLSLVQRQGHNVFTWGVFASPVGACLGWIGLMLLQQRAPFSVQSLGMEMLPWATHKGEGLSYTLARGSRVLQLLACSGVWVTLFLGGWQVPFLSTPFLQAQAVPLSIAFCLLLGVMLLYGALLLLSSVFQPLQRWGDIRDRESARALLPFVALASALFALAFTVLPNYSLFAPLWLSHCARALFQLVSFSGKLILVSALVLWCQNSLPTLRWESTVGRYWRWWVPIGVLNLFATGLWSRLWLTLWGVK